MGGNTCSCMFWAVLRGAAYPLPRAVGSFTDRQAGRMHDCPSLPPPGCVSLQALTLRLTDPCVCWTGVGTYWRPKCWGQITVSWGWCLEVLSKSLVELLEQGVPQASLA